MGWLIIVTGLLVTFCCYGKKANIMTKRATLRKCLFSLQCQRLKIHPGGKAMEAEAGVGEITVFINVQEAEETGIRMRL